MLSSLFAPFTNLDTRLSRRFRAAIIAVGAAFVASPAPAVPEITVAQKRTTLTDDGSFNFGTIRSDKSLLQTFTITNNGDTDLTLLGVSVGLPFEIVFPPAGVVAAGKRTSVRVNLPAGLVPGMKSGVFTIVNDDPNENPFTVTLTAVVQPVEPDADVLAGSVGLSSGSAFDMGTTEAGVGSARKFTIQNTGNADLVLSSPSIEGQGFALDFPKGRTIKPGKRLNFTVRFFDTTAGEFDGILRLPNNDPDEGDYELELLATLTPADARVRVFSQGIALDNGDPVDFGSTRSDQTIVRVFTVRNEGRATLSLGPAVVAGAGFELLSQPRTSLARGKSTKFRARLNPGSTGAAPTGMLTFPTNDPDHEVFLIPLVAGVTVVRPAISVSGPGGTVVIGSAVELDPTNVSQAQQSTFNIINTGSSTLTLGTVTVAGTGYSLVRIPATTVEPGRSTSFVVRLFSAALLDPAPGSVSFATNAPGSEAFSFSLAGAVRVVPLTPEVEVTETLLNASGNPVMVNVGVGATRNYGSLVAGNRRTRDYTIRNSGTAALALSGLMLTNTTGTGFGIATGAPLPASLAPNATTTFSILFLPPSDGGFAANVAFTNNDPDDGENPFTFGVTGAASPAVLAFNVFYTGFETVEMKRLPNPLPPIGSRPYPFSLGSVAAGGTRIIHNTAQDSFVIRNRGLSPLIVSGSVVVDPVPPSPMVWLGELSPGPCFPVACPLPPIVGSDQLNITHDGLTPGPRRGLVTIITDAPALNPWEFEIQEWVNDWFSTTGGLGVPGESVRAFTTFDPDGTGAAVPAIIAGGSFTTPAGSPRIATLNAGAWTALPGGGINTPGGSVNALAVFDEPDANPPALFAGGSAFINVGAAPAPVVSVNNIAKWNGMTWATLGTGAANGVTGGAVNALAVYDRATPATDPASQLYVGGAFTSAGGVAAQGIARWNGTAWNKLLATNDGVSGGAINAMAVFDADGTGPLPAELYVGGGFTNASSLPLAPVNGITRFNGSTWTPLGIAPNSGVSGQGARINAMVVFDADGPEGPANATLVVGGSFTNASTLVNVNNIAQWTGTVWQPFGSGTGPGTGNEVFALAVFDEDAFHPEDDDGFTNNDPTLPRLKRRTQVGRLYAAGAFLFGLPGGNPVNNIARWDAGMQQWTPVGTDVSNGTNGEIRAIHPFDPDGLLSAGNPNSPEQLFVGGLFTNVIQLAPAPGMLLPVNNIAVWSATTP